MKKVEKKETKTTTTSPTKTEPKKGFNGLEEVLNKRMGPGTMRRASQLAPDPIRIQTNCLAFDMASGGGIPLWCVTLMYGPDGGGKTNLCLDACASAMKTCFRCFRPVSICECSQSPMLKKVLWADVDGTFNPQWAEAIGIDPERIYIVHAEFGEAYLESVRLAIQEEECGLAVVDDIAALVTIPEMEHDMMKQHMAELPRLVSRANRILKSHLVGQIKAKHPVAIMTTNEIRMKLGVRFGNPETQPGGNAVRHGTSLRGRIGKRSWGDPEREESKNKKEKYTDKDRKIVLASPYRFTLEKYKLFRMFGAGEFIRVEEDFPELNLEKGEIDDSTKLRKDAERYGLIEQDKKKWRVLGMDKSATRKTEILNGFTRDEKQVLRWLTVQAAKNEYIRQHEKSNKHPL